MSAVHSSLGGFLILVACGGPPQASTRSPDTITAGQQHDAIAQVSDSTAPAAPKSYRCGDPVLNDQVTTGNERLTTFVPCWDLEEEAEHARQAHAERSDPQMVRARETHRGALAAAELVYCKGMSERELTHSPFAHKKAIVDVIPHRREGEIRGVRIVFRRIPGLTASWLQDAIACHRARHASLGRPANYLPEDPTLVEGAEVRVTQTKEHVLVFVTTPQPGAARVAYERANELVRPKSALRR